MTKQPKITYQEKYDRNAWLKEDNLPVLNHMMPGFQVKAARLVAAGKLDDGTEFMDLRVIIEEKE